MRDQRGILAVTRRLHLSLASKLLILSVTIIVVISVIFWCPSIRHIQKEELNKNINFAESQMDVIERALHYGMLTNNREFIKETIESVATMDNILWIRVVDAEGTVRFASIRGEFNDVKDHGSRDEVSSLPEKRLWTVEQRRGQKVLDIIQPIHNRHACYSAQCHFHSKEQRILGKIESGYSLQSVDTYIRKQGYTVAAFGFVFIAVLSLPLYLIVNRLILKPVALLSEGMQRVTAGDLSHIINLDNRDELGMLAHSFNSMTRQLRERSEAVTKELDQYRSSLLHAQKMEAVGTLSAGIAHDFNNILTGITGYSELVVEANPQPPVSEYAGRILDLTQRATEFIQQILLIGRKLPPARRPLDINELIGSSMKMLRRMVEENIEIKVFPKSDPCLVDADATQIDQVLMNLVVNARDAMSDGGVIEIRTGGIRADEVYCRLHAYPKPGDYVFVDISDTGCGIPEDISGRIFEPFFTTKVKGKGTGLGLAVTYSIIKSHGGWIDFVSEAGKGTTFTVYLPALTPDSLAAVKGEISGKEALPIGKESILLVDDDEVIRELGISILGRLGYRVITASNGEEAVRIYSERTEEIALVIMDRIMPKVDGIQAYNQLKEINPLVKVIISSGYSADEAESLRNSGVFDFLDKPYRIGEMANVVRKAIDGTQG